MWGSESHRDTTETTIISSCLHRLAHRFGPHGLTHGSISMFNDVLLTAPVKIQKISGTSLEHSLLFYAILGSL